VRETLAFDHGEIPKAAIFRLRSKVEYTSLPAFLMPVEFTLTELQRMYEIPLARKLEKKAFYPTHYDRADANGIFRGHNLGSVHIQAVGLTPSPLIE
jgi:hypothetical protein